MTTLLIPKADEYSAVFRDSVEETDRGTAARWSTAVRSIPAVVLAGVIAIAASAAATATWRSSALTTMDFWLLAASVLAQAGFAFTVRYLVPVVPAQIVLLRPVAGADWRKLNVMTYTYRIGKIPKGIFPMPLQSKTPVSLPIVQ